MYCPGASSPLGLRTVVSRAPRLLAVAFIAADGLRDAAGGVREGGGRVVARHEEQRLEQLVHRVGGVRHERRPGCPRRWRPPTARCRRSSGSSFGSSVSAVSTLRVLAGRRRPCGFWAASTSPVSRSASRRRGRRRLGSAVAPGASTTMPVRGQRARRRPSTARWWLVGRRGAETWPSRPGPRPRRRAPGVTSSSSALPLGIDGRLAPRARLAPGTTHDRSVRPRI